MDDKLKFSNKESEEDVPFIKPEDCPGAVIKYFNKQRNADYLAIREIMREELMPVHKFMKMTANNQIWLWILSAVVTGIIVVLSIHLGLK